MVNYAFRISQNCCDRPKIIPSSSRPQAATPKALLVYWAAIFLRNDTDVVLSSPAAGAGGCEQLECDEIIKFFFSLFELFINNMEIRFMPVLWFYHW